jgi:hypothetical protein
MATLPAGSWGVAVTGAACHPPPPAPLQVSFIEARGGGTTSTELLDHFEPLLPAGQMPLLRQLVKQVATLQKQPGGASSWALRREFGGSGGGGTGGGGAGGAAAAGRGRGAGGASLSAFDHLYDDDGGSRG